MSKKEDNKLYSVQCLYVFTYPNSLIKNAHTLDFRVLRVLIEGEFAEELQCKPMHKVMLENYLYKETNWILPKDTGPAVGKVIGYRTMTETQHFLCSGLWEAGNPENVYFIGNCPGKPVEQIEFGYRHGLCYPECISKIFANPKMQAFHVANLGVVIDGLLEKIDNSDDHNSYKHFAEISEKISFPVFTGETLIDINNDRSVTIIGKRKQSYETNGTGLIYKPQISQQRFIM